jgi:hypothetical protein
MKWYHPSEKLPSNNSIVVIWYGTGLEVVDPKIDRTVYNWYQLAFYTDNEWETTAGFSLAENTRIDAWCEVPRYIKDIEQIEEKAKQVEAEKIKDRFELLDL